jgi:hypothetical protein
MLTRGRVTHQYGQHAGNASPPPFHAYMHEHQYPQHTSLARMHGPGGGLAGGAVTLNTRGWTGMRLGNTGYGYLGMDPSDPSTWPRPFVPTAGMISYLNFGAVT